MTTADTRRLLLVALTILLGLAGCSGGPLGPKKPEPFRLTSESFHDNTQMPKVYTVDGADISPPLSWRGAPDGTKEFALIMDDPDARGFVHWLIYKIPATVDTLPENLPRDAVIAQPITALQGTSSFRAVGYRGPAARKGGGVHNYHFTLYALSEPLDVQPSLDKQALLSEMEGKVIDKAQLIGRNER